MTTEERFHISFILSGRANAGGCDEKSFESSACEGYRPVLNKDGKNVVIGTVAFEGYLAGASLLWSQYSPIHYQCPIFYEKLIAKKNC